MIYAAVGGAHKEAAVGGAILLDRRLWGRGCPGIPSTKGWGGLPHGTLKHQLENYTGSVRLCAAMRRQVMLVIN